MSSVRVGTPPCPECGRVSQLDVPVEVLAELHSPNGRLLQDLLPDWSTDQRELLLSGIHPECWDKIVGDDEEEDPRPPDDALNQDPPAELDPLVEIVLVTKCAYTLASTTGEGVPMLMLQHDVLGRGLDALFDRLIPTDAEGLADPVHDAYALAFLEEARGVDTYGELLELLDRRLVKVAVR